MFKEHKKEIKRERSGKKRRPSKNNEWIKDMTTMETSSLSRCRDGVSASQSPLLSSAAVAASSFNEPTPNEWIIPLCRKAVSDNDKRSCGNCITLQRNPYLLGLLTIEIGWGTVMNGSLQCSSLMRSWTELTVWVSFFLFSSFLVGLGFWGFFFLRVSSFFGFFLSSWVSSLCGVDPHAVKDGSLLSVGVLLDKCRSVKWWSRYSRRRKRLIMIARE